MNITEDMAKFIAKNKEVAIVFGETVTASGRSVERPSEVNSSSMVRYQFADGEIMLLSRGDLLSAPDFQPKWDIGE